MAVQRRRVAKGRSRETVAAYSRVVSGIYNPSLDPANQAGLLVAAIAFVVVLAATLRQGRRTETPT